MRREAAERAVAEATAETIQAEPACEMPTAEVEEPTEEPKAESTATVTKAKPKAPSRAS